MVVSEACNDEFVDIAHHVGNLRLQDGPVASSRGASSVAGNSSMNSPRLNTRSSTPAEPSPSCGVRQTHCARNSVQTGPCGTQATQATQAAPANNPAHYDGYFYVVVVGRSPGVYRNA